MPENDNRAYPVDRDHVALGNEDQIQYWTSHFGVDQVQLEEAVDAVGDDVAAVAAYLNQ
ncbi:MULTISPECIES: DUF3606 domain-containing protein [Sphingobium]|jgi:hypothetical protein|uniref:DUF3606 domain-containing protein n=1 Tax=Sphingomonas sanxanigenens TaxID=397260 RepID=A0A2W5ACA4_9SPHN|nr:DUF3606 domain-containing protein [Sphingobium yanoikuyae]PZO90892.1 MAG: DUF3606 domain-containing protein [Sphingomonas sanxanigenens]